MFAFKELFLTHRTPLFAVRASIAVALAAGLLQITPSAQNRLQTMPGHEQFQRVSAESRDALKSGALSVTLAVTLVVPSRTSSAEPTATRSSSRSSPR